MRISDWSSDVCSSDLVYPAGPVHLAFIGRVKRYKAPDLLASTVQDLPPSTARLVIAGYCTDADLTAELRQAAASAGNIHLQLEYLSDAEIERITDEADAVVLPYRSEEHTSELQSLLRTSYAV